MVKITKMSFSTSAFFGCKMEKFKKGLLFSAKCGNIITVVDLPKGFSVTIPYLRVRYK